MNLKNMIDFQKLRQCFDWTPVAVNGPHPCYKTYSDVGKVLLGYEVVVKYLYHGDRKCFFQTDEEKMGFISDRRALKNADCFYNKIKAKIAKSKRVQNEY